jgi:formylglycine-generating enzyme required for sulfatase activity
MANHTFISYTHEDSHFVTRLARRLRARGVKVWLDQWDIAPEAEWDVAIERAVQRCACLMVILSPAAVNSWVVRQQFTWAEQNGTQILLVLYEACDLPAPLQDLPLINFVEQRYNLALSQLLHHYFPDQEVQDDMGTKLKSRLINLDWSWWHRLRPLLWPGWLGPALLLAILVMWAMFFWSGDRAEFAQPVAAEALSIVTATRTPTPPPPTRVRPTDEQVMVYVPAGEFFMGSPVDDPLADEDEWPRHAVYVDGFWMDRTEITNQQYHLCVEAKGCEPASYQSSNFAGAQLPVVGVDWFQAAAYCEWTGARLPSEAEWEKAARGLDGRVYPWGFQFEGDRLNYCDQNCIQDWKDSDVDDGYKYTAPVGSYPTGASPYGVLDLSGNVWEWTADWYAADYYTQTPYRNPTGPASGQQRVIRGGAWHYTGRSLRSVNRHKDTPIFRYDKTGFRCVVDAN